MEESFFRGMLQHQLHINFKRYRKTLFNKWLWDKKVSTLSFVFFQKLPEKNRRKFELTFSFKNENIICTWNFKMLEPKYFKCIKKFLNFLWSILSRFFPIHRVFFKEFSSWKEKKFKSNSSRIQIAQKLLCQSPVISFFHFHRHISFKFALIFRIIIFLKFDTFPISLFLYSHARNTPSHLQISPYTFIDFSFIFYKHLVHDFGGWWEREVVRERKEKKQ